MRGQLFRQACYENQSRSLTGSCSMTAFSGAPTSDKLDQPFGQFANTNDRQNQLTIHTKTKKSENCFKVRHGKPLQKLATTP